MGLPGRWLDYTCYGNVMNNTKIIAFKVPLKMTTCKNLVPSDQFTPQMLMNALPNLKYIVDLTDTTRYYDKMDFVSAGIKYTKVNVIGGKVPSSRVSQKFNDIVNSYMTEVKENEIIGVHCTHGLNRTGFMVCQYLIRQFGWNALDAIKEFENARGHSIERQPYLRALQDMAARVPIDIINHNEDDGNSLYNWSRNRTSGSQNWQDEMRPSTQPLLSDYRQRNHPNYIEPVENWRNYSLPQSLPPPPTRYSQQSHQNIRREYRETQNNVHSSSLSHEYRYKSPSKYKRNWDNHREYASSPRWQRYKRREVFPNHPEFRNSERNSSNSRYSSNHSPRSQLSLRSSCPYQTSSRQK